VKSPSAIQGQRARDQPPPGGHEPVEPNDQGRAASGGRVRPTSTMALPDTTMTGAPGTPAAKAIALAREIGHVRLSGPAEAVAPHGPCAVLPAGRGSETRQGNMYRLMCRWTP
jgi:hypothetical protein